ncbi:branched-chain amino acid ABC transporter substrate-binding protein [Nonomuraea sp. NPDC046570]|uniref:branched-chain amino acid ABC transporter substrate-binding protein n=1 Tax=Nonomuraea sp. NPDC046570 TaxID=3155255 RepID=UPI0033FF94D1
MRPRIARFGGALAVGTALTLGLAACGGGSDTPKQDATGGGDAAAPASITVGFVGDLAGDNAAIVIPPRNGAQLAFDEYNAKNPKVKIEFKAYDSKGDASTAANLVKTAIQNDKISALIGPAFSGESQQVQPILEEAKIPSVSPSATRTDLASKGAKYWHRIVANDDVQGPGAAEFAGRAITAKKVFVIDDKSAYGQGLAQAVAKTMGEKGAEVQADSFEATETDFSAAVNKAAAFKPDFVFFGGYYAQGGPLLKQLRDKGVTGRFMSGDGSLHTKFIEGAGAQQAEGTLFSCPCKIAYAFAAKDEKAKTFTETFKTKFQGQLPEIYATEGYDAASTIIKAVEAGNTTPEKINEFIATADFEGLGKHVKYNPNGEIADTNVYIYQVKNGTVEAVGNSKDATLG